MFTRTPSSQQSSPHLGVPAAAAAAAGSPRSRPPPPGAAVGGPARRGLQSTPPPPCPRARRSRPPGSRTGGAPGVEASRPRGWRGPAGGPPASPHPECPAPARGAPAPAHPWAPVPAPNSAGTTPVCELQASGCRPVWERKSPEIQPQCSPRTFCRRKKVAWGAGGRGRALPLGRLQELAV